MIVLGAWLSLNGVWPLADPGHTNFIDPMVTVDWILHLVGLAIVARWFILRRKAG